MGIKNKGKNIFSMAGLLAVTLLLTTSALTFAGSVDPKTPLPVDPKIKIGTLPNGMQYWIREHATPPGKIGMWLHIGSGAVNEDDDQRGVAHFLEHMAFNGSKHFPPGTLVKFFESLGMRFGADQNAFTGFDQTTYIMSLPETKAEILDKGLLYFADVAFGLDLSEKEIDKERKVILEEKRSRKGAGQRIIEKLLPILLPGARAADRLPIGKESVITAAKREQFVRYYNKWYHPAKTTLLVVGDLKADLVEAKIKSHFAAWKPKGKAAADVDPGIKPYTETRATVITDKEVSVAEIGATNILAMASIKTIGDYRQKLLQDLGNWIVNRRYSALVRSGKAPFQNAYNSVSTFLNVCTYVNAEAKGKPEQWQPMLTSLLREIKRARDFGFLEQELADAKLATLSGAQQGLKTESTRSARAFLSSMNGAVSQKRTPMSAAQRLAILQQLLPGISATEVLEKYKKNFAATTRLLVLTFPDKEGLKVPTKEELLATAKSVEAEKLTGLKAKVRPKNLLKNDPTPGSIKKSKEDSDLNILSATLSNGVKVHFRKMDFKKNQVSVRLTFPGGELLETAKNRGIGQAATLILSQKASQSLSSTDITNMMTGKQVGVGGSIGRDSMNIGVSGSPDDLEEGLRLLYLMLTEGKLEASALKLWKERSLQHLELAKSEARIQMGNAWRDLVYGNDPRTKALTKEQINNITLKAAQQWFTTQLVTGPIEVAIVGDIERDKAMKLAEKYLGSLPDRKLKASYVSKYRKVKLEKGPSIHTVKVDTETPKSYVLLGWRGADAKKVDESRALFIAESVLSKRLRDEIREERGLTYSTGCRNVPGKYFKKTGFLYVIFTADPDKVVEAAKIAKEVVDKFVIEGPDEEEMKTAHKQFKVSIEKNQKTPGFWSGVLADLDYRDRKLKDEKEDAEIMGSYPRKSVMKVLKKYIRDENYLQVIALPKNKAATDKKVIEKKPVVEKKAGEKKPVAEKSAVEEKAAPEKKVVEKKAAAKDAPQAQPSKEQMAEMQKAAAEYVQKNMSKMSPEELKKGLTELIKSKMQENEAPTQK